MTPNDQTANYFVKQIFVDKINTANQSPVWINITQVNEAGDEENKYEPFDVSGPLKDYIEGGGIFLPITPGEEYCGDGQVSPGEGCDFGHVAGVAPKSFCYEGQVCDASNCICVGKVGPVNQFEFVTETTKDFVIRDWTEIGGAVYTNIPKPIDYGFCPGKLGGNKLVGEEDEIPSEVIGQPAAGIGNILGNDPAAAQPWLGADVVSSLPYCGDGVPNQSWEECDGSTTGCTAFPNPISCMNCICCYADIP